MKDRIRVLDSKLLSDDRYILRKTRFEYRRRDGRWQTLTRETYDRGNGAAILLIEPRRRTVVLVRQFRFPAFANGHSGDLVEVPAGMIDEGSPEETIRREAEEEVGLRVGTPRKVFEAFMSPGAVTEKLFFFMAEYDAADRIAEGGGLEEEGEDIEVLEVPLDEALAMIARGEIVDAKTIMLLQYARLRELGAAE